jgi:3-demethoxyubiquinol 3-hydroxylase
MSDRAGSMGRGPRPALPGEGTGARAVEAMIRVDHAGEFAATRIYAGQRAVFSRVPRLRALADLMARQEADEIVHKAAFDQQIATRGVRPTALAPVWGAAAYGLGVVTALMGEKAAHACTAAVEEVIEEHYRDQEAALAARHPEEGELATMIARFRDEEVAHRDEAVAHGAKEAPAHPILEGLIKAGCRAAIAVAKRV